MTRLIRLAAAFALLAALTACGTYGQAVKPGTNGYLATGDGKSEKAHTVVAEKIDLTVFKQLAVTTTRNANVDQIRSLGYFDEVIDVPELQRRIVASNLQDKVPSISDRIGLSNAARYYKKFLWIHNDIGKHDDNSFVRLVITDPSTSRDVFIAEREMNSLMTAYNAYTDQNTWYPLFNSMLEWLHSN